MLFEQVFKNEKQRLVESYVYQDPLFEQWQGVGQIIAERKMTEPEILDLFSKVETGMTNKDTGVNRTMLGRGKDKTTKAYTTVKDAFSSVMSSIQNSAPVQAVDVAYDQATDAVANLQGGQKTKIMQAIKGYRNLVKEYPKTAGFAKAALVAIAGLATGGAGLPAIAGLTYALDSAIRGDKLSSVIGKGTGAAAVTWAGQAAAGALKGQGAAAGAGADSSVSAADSLGAGETIAGTGGQEGKLLSWSQGIAPGDTLSSIAQKYNVSVDELLKANPQITNPDVLQAGTSIQIPTNNFQGDQWGSGNPTYDKGVGTSADTMAKIKTGQYTDSPISQALAKKVRESVTFKKLPIEQLFDHKLTVMSWALSESVGRQEINSMHLTTAGVYTVFENVGRYAKAVIKEAVGPGRPDLPDEYRPDMPGGAGGYDKSKKGIVGKGLDWLDRTAGKVGGALSKFGHQFTTKVTKEKLKMNWHQAGKPSDSDALAAFLVKQGVPQEVVNDVYGAMNIPTSTAPAAASAPAAGLNTAPAAAAPAATSSVASSASAASSAASAPTASTAAAKPALPQATSATAGQPSAVTYGKGFEKKPAATTQFPSFGGAGTNKGYATAPTTPTLPKPTTSKISPAAPAAPAAPKVPAAPAVTAPATSGTTGTYDKKTGAAKLGGKTMMALKDLPPAVQQRLSSVAEQANRMLENVKTKQDADDVRLFVDQKFAEYGLLESALPQRKQIIEHVTKVSAIRRRLHARNMLT